MKSYRTLNIRLYEEHWNKEEILERINKFKSIKKYAFILHNKDILESGDIKKPHWHIVLELNNPTGEKTVSNFFPKKTEGKEEQKIMNCNSLNASYAYLLHTYQEHKHQYGMEEVFCNFDFMEKIKEIGKKNKTERYGIKRRGEVEAIIKGDYLEGKINLIDLKKLITPRDFLENDKMIERASKVRYSYFKKVNRDITVFYFYGKTGSGKTTTAKKLFKEAYGEDNIFVSGSSNDSLEDYEGQKLLILDDLRGDSFKFHNLLKLLDNHTNSKVKSRYQNKFIEAEVIVITSVKSPFELYPSIKGEDLNQLIRRLYIYNIYRKGRTIMVEESKTQKIIRQFQMEKDINKRRELANELLRSLPMKQEKEEIKQQYIS